MAKQTKTVRYVVEVETPKFWAPIGPPCELKADAKHVVKVLREVDAKEPGREMCEAWISRRPPLNVWLGTTVEDQQRANERIPHLLSVPARVHFLSCEPLLERVDLSQWLDEDRTGFVGLIDWVIIGGESGHGARPFALDWARSLIAQCRDGGRAEAAPFVKQLGARPVFGDGDLPDSMWQAYDTNGYDHEEIAAAARDGRLRFVDPAGGDMAEWPEDLRVREFPRVTP